MAWWERLAEPLALLHLLPANQIPVDVSSTDRLPRAPLTVPSTRLKQQKHTLSQSQSWRQEAPDQGVSHTPSKAPGWGWGGWVLSCLFQLLRFLETLALP